MRVVAAMSGGVDSAVSAARMVEAGHEVVGVHLALSQQASVLRESARGCCTLEDSADARRVADRLGIPFYVWDLAERFRVEVVEDFVAEYAQGRTPNPCLRCNERIKFHALLDKALALGFDAVATGHYARIVTRGDTGGRELHRAVDAAKDQSYVLGVLDQDQLARAFFPLGDSTKTQVRAEAAERGFAVAKKPDSHDICFIADGDTRGWLTRRLGAQPGVILDEEGDVVGEHGGAYAFTVGQRKGLHLPRPSSARASFARCGCSSGIRMPWSPSLAQGMLGRSPARPRRTRGTAYPCFPPGWLNRRTPRTPRTPRSRLPPRERRPGTRLHSADLAPTMRT